MVARKVVVTVPSWTDHEITIPEKCQECGADFSDPENLRAVVNAFIPGGVTFENDGTVLAQGDDECEIEGPSDFMCANCGRSLLEGAALKTA